MEKREDRMELAKFPFPQPDPTQPPREYARLRAEAPVSPVMLPTGDRAWLVTRHADVLTVLSDERFSRAALTGPDAPKLAPIPPMPSLFYLDPPQHTRVRRLAAQAFHPARLERLRTRVEQVVGSHVDQLLAADQPADLLGAVARPLPLAVVATVLGVPADRYPDFSGWVGTAFSFGAVPPDRQMAAMGQLLQFLGELIGARRKEPENDILSDLILGVDGDQLADHELTALIFDLLGAGDQPVTAEIVHLLLNVMRDPGRLDLLHVRPEFVQPAVEELLRVSQSAGGGIGSIRIAVADVRLGDVTIPAGDPVIPSFNAANFDEAVFPDAAEIDLTRQSNPHLTFAQGIHHCIGAPIGRMELTALLRRLARDTPRLRLAIAESDLRWLPVPAFRTPGQIPVRW
jgi:cytochrome P450